MINAVNHPLKGKSFRFGVEVYGVCNEIVIAKKEWVLTRQLMRSSTSIGALCAESAFAQSRPDFIHKLSIARKECNESKYWIELMKEIGLLEISRAQELINSADELMRLLTASIKTAQRNLPK